MMAKRKHKDEIFDWILSTLEHGTPPEDGKTVYEDCRGVKDGLELTYDVNGATKKFHVKIEDT